MAKLDKTSENDAAARAEALSDVAELLKKQVTTLAKAKKTLGDKLFATVKDKLYALLDEAEGLHKSATAKAAEAKVVDDKSKAKGKDDEEEEETPALLTSKMVPLLRALKKGDATMPFLIALAGKETVVLVSRRPISPARGKLLKAQMAQPTGLKFIRGEGQYENNALTFVVQSPAAALAKRLRQALLDQTEMRWKVRVRGEDGLEEEDGENVDQEQEGVKAQAPSAPPGGPASAEQLAYTQRLRKVRERYEQALHQHPQATKLRELMRLASEKADDKRDYAGALQVLQALDKALDEPARAEDGGVDPGVAFKARLTALLPRMKETIAAAGPTAKDIKLKASEAGVFATKKDFDQANRLLDDVESLMTMSVGPKGGDGRVRDRDPKVSAEEVACTQRREALAPRISAALRANLGDTSKIRALSAFVQEKADEKKDYVAAMRAMDMLENLLPEQPAATGVTPPTEEALALAPEFPKRWNEAKAAWRSAMEIVDGQLDTLRGSLLLADDPDLGQIAEFGLNAITANHRVPLDAALIDVDKAPDDRKETAIERALARVVAFRNHIETDERVDACDNNPFEVKVTIRAELGGALARLEEALDDAFV